MTTQALPLPQRWDAFGWNYLELVVFIFSQACLLMILQTRSIFDLNIIFFFV
jgi:hypothetical protein